MLFRESDGAVQTFETGGAVVEVRFSGGLIPVVKKDAVLRVGGSVALWGRAAVEEGPGTQRIESHLPGEIEDGLNHGIGCEAEVVVVRSPDVKGLLAKGELGSSGADEFRIGGPVDRHLSALPIQPKGRVR